MTTTATVPTAAERNGDFSGMGAPLLNLAAGGTPFPGNQIAAAGDQSGRAQRGEPVSARQRVAVDLSRNADREERAGSVRRAHRLQWIVEQPDVRALLLFGRPQPQPGVGARHRRARLSDARRSGGAFGGAVEHAHLHAVADAFGARQRAALQVLLRSAPEQDAAERARIRLRLVERAGRRGRRSSTSPATRRSAARSPGRATRRSGPTRSRTA